MNDAKLQGYLDMVRRHLARPYTPTMDVERSIVDQARACIARYFGAYGALEVRTDEPGMLYAAVYLDGPAPLTMDPRRMPHCRVLAGARTVTDLDEQLRYLRDNDMLPRRMTQ